MIKAVLCIWFDNRYLEGSDIIHTLKVLNKHYAVWKLEFSHPQEKINQIDIETMSLVVLGLKSDSFCCMAKSVAIKYAIGELSNLSNNLIKDEIKIEFK